MRVKLLIILITLITRFSYGQNLNVVIQVNEKLVVAEIAGAKLNYQNLDKTISSTQVRYNPGELIIDDESWTKLKSDSTQKISLTFDFYTYTGTQQ